MHTFASQAPGGKDRRPRNRQWRRGVAAMDYVLVMGMILPLAAFLLWAAPRIMNLVYEMLTVLVSWPFM